MLPVEIAVLADPLRLKPDSELQPEPVDPPDKLPQRLAQLFLIDIPVAQSAEIIIPLPEPPVVHDQHLYAKLRRFFCKLIERFPAELKI